MTTLSRNAEYLARLFAFAASVNEWRVSSAHPLQNEASLRYCEKWIAWHTLYLVGAYS